MKKKKNKQTLKVQVNKKEKSTTRTTNFITLNLQTGVL